MSLLHYHCRQVTFEVYYVLSVRLCYLFVSTGNVVVQIIWCKKINISLNSPPQQSVYV